jgi:hypothetical protein
MTSARTDSRPPAGGEAWAVRAEPDRQVPEAFNNSGAGSLGEATAAFCGQHQIGNLKLPKPRRMPARETDDHLEANGVTSDRWHTRKLEWADAVSSGSIRVIGPRPLARALPTWNRRGFQTERRYEEVRVG